MIILAAVGVDFNLLSVVTFVFHLPSVAMVEPVPVIVLHRKVHKDKHVTQCHSGYYKDQSRSQAYCRKCSVCPRGYIEKQACTLTNNTACEQCSVGTFQNRRGGGCKECSKCGKGEFVRRPCRPYKNTRCKPCPEGTFSDDGSRWACKYCQRCWGNQIQLLPCTQTRDTTCGEGFINKLDREERGDNPEEDLEYNVHTRVTLVATCAVLSSLFLIFLLAFVLQTYDKYAHSFLFQVY
ncbi:tumor necrosis factor receptor superfamily member 6B-like [Mya arenaria]|uniref:tumor necrosis factor receptor superfamily member 6B-like n=1 Tax=Mya arenaria TaxID=6604 RepID=UPI0022E61C49|nr:tumor necrosis factor receptor superfamily member 6B-like [Mya arenaria]